MWNETVVVIEVTEETRENPHTLPLKTLIFRISSQKLFVSG